LGFCFLVEQRKKERQNVEADFIRQSL
jgi:hypothetical protein